MEDCYNTEEFGNICKITGELEVCQKYIKENGGDLYTQIDGDKEYTLDDGYTSNVYYAKGNLFVNRTGMYGVA